MTLIDTRPGIAAVWDALSAETGVPVDSAAAVSRLGPPLDEEVARWFPAEQVGAIGDRFRELYPGLAVAPHPGVRAERVRRSRRSTRHGGRAIVVTGKYEPNARLHLEHLGIAVDEVRRLAVGAAEGRRAAASTARPSTSGTTSATWWVPGPQGRSRSAWRPDRSPPTSCGTRARTSSSPTSPSSPPGWTSTCSTGGWRISPTRCAPSARWSWPSPAAPTRRSCWPPPYAPWAPSTSSPPPRSASSLPASELVGRGAPSRRPSGVRHLTPETDEMSRDGYRANAGDRCYFCKAELLDVLAAARRRARDRARSPPAPTPTTPVAGFRPGIRAAAERAAATPLLDAGLTKAQVRAASRDWGLRHVGQARSRLPVQPGRFRPGDHAGPAGPGGARRGSPAGGARRGGHRSARRAGARPRRPRRASRSTPAAVDAVTASAAARQVVLDAGFAAVEVDPRGFRSGAMNELLADPARYR